MIDPLSQASGAVARLFLVAAVLAMMWAVVLWAR